MTTSKIILILFIGSNILFHTKTGAAQQKILLIGTHHQTSDDRVEEMTPIAVTVEQFNPGIICVEYPMRTDTASLLFGGAGQQTFNHLEGRREAWNIPAGDMNIKIETLQQDPDLSSDLQKQLQLQLLYYLSSDRGNSDYWGYRIMNSQEKDSLMVAKLRETSSGFKVMQATYEYKLGRNNPYYLNNEYYRLVFPLAAKLNIPYLYPIDDLSTWKSYETYYDRIHGVDSMEVGTLKYRQYTKDFLRELHTLPASTNRWIFTNSPQFINDLRIGGYTIDTDNSSDNIKMLQYFWVLRNRTMAQHIDAVARRHPNINIVVFFGAAHTGAVREELNKLKKSYQVLTLFDVMK